MVQFKPEIRSWSSWVECKSGSPISVPAPGSLIVIMYDKRHVRSKVDSHEHNLRQHVRGIEGPVYEHYY